MKLMKVDYLLFLTIGLLLIATACMKSEAPIPEPAAGRDAFSCASRPRGPGVLLDNFPSPSESIYLRTLQVSQTGDVLLAGGSYTARNDAGQAESRWVARSSMDGGASWKTSEALKTRLGVIYAGAIGFNKELVVAGYESNVWSIRWNHDGEDAWRMTDYFHIDNGTAQVFQLHRDESRKILFSTGNAWDAAHEWHGIVRKSAARLDQPWVTVRDVRIGSDPASDFLVDSQGKLWFAYHTQDAVSQKAILETSPDGGATWSKADEVVFPGSLSTSSSVPRMVREGTNGKIYWAAAGGEISLPRWMIREIEPSTGQVRTVDDFSLGAGKQVVPEDMWVQDEILYVSGWARIDEARRFVTRKISLSESSAVLSMQGGFFGRILGIAADEMFFTLRIAESAETGWTTGSLSFVTQELTVEPAVEEKPKYLRAQRFDQLKNLYVGGIDTTPPSWTVRKLACGL